MIEAACYFFVKNGCPLCGKHHSVEFYIFVARHVIIALDADPLIIKVVRIFCEVNFEIKKEQQIPLQYTITVLPGFLLPYSRILSDRVFNTVDGYIRGQIHNQYAAAIMLNCNSRHTFRLYYIRIQRKLDTWLTATLPKKTEIETNQKKPVNEKWQIVSNYMKDWTPPHLSGKWQAYGHAIFCFKKMGLGP